MATIAFSITRDGFNNFEDENYAMFLYRLNPAYTIPSAQLFLKKLLDKEYDII